MELKNKHVVITGGSDGLGFAIAQKFIEKEARVHLIARDKQKLEAAKAKLNGQVNIYSADVGDPAAIEAVSQEIDQVSVVINNAGVWLEGQITDNSIEQIDRTIDTNLKGTIYVTRAFLPKLLKQNQAHLINISSTSGLKGRDNQAVYAASKFGVTGFTESLKNDLADTSVKVTGFYPGGMNTQLFAKTGTPKDNSDWMDPAKVAQIVFMITQTDQTMVLDHLVLNKRLVK